MNISDRGWLPQIDKDNTIVQKMQDETTRSQVCVEEEKCLQGEDNEEQAPYDANALLEERREDNIRKTNGRLGKQEFANVKEKCEKKQQGTGTKRKNCNKAQKSQSCMVAGANWKRSKKNYIESP